MHNLQSKNICRTPAKGNGRSIVCFSEALANRGIWQEAALKSNLGDIIQTTPIFANPPQLGRHGYKQPLIGSFKSVVSDILLQLTQARFNELAGSSRFRNNFDRDSSAASDPRAPVIQLKG